MRDPEFWFPLNEDAPRGGRPKVWVRRTLEEFPPPTPQKTPCRLWQGAVDGDGYGMLSSYEHHGRRTKKYVHRWVWEMARGPIPKGMVIRHRCDNRVCFRLSHLEIGTVADNNRDAQERGHLGSVRVMPPSVVREIWARRSGGEKWGTIIPDYPEYSPATVKRVKDYIHQCNTDSSTDSPASAATPSDAAVQHAHEHDVRLPDGTRVVH